MDQTRKRKTNTGPVRTKINTGAKERTKDALELRIAGYTLEEIAASFGYASPSSVSKAIRRAIMETPAELAKELRTMEEFRLDGMQMAIWEKAEAGDLGAIDRVLKIMERRARLLGLDIRRESPVQIQTDPSFMTISTQDMSDKEREEYLSALMRRREELPIPANIGHDKLPGHF